MTRIKGPTDGPRPVDESGAIAETGDAAPASGARPTEAARVGGTSAAGLDAVGQVAARLRAGEIGVDEAIELLIEDAVKRQIGRATESARDLEHELREILRGFAAKDPFLAERIRRLTLDK